MTDLFERNKGPLLPGVRGVVLLLFPSPPVARQMQNNRRVTAN